MASIIVKDGKLGVSSGKLVADTGGGAPCCCDEEPPPCACPDGSALPDECCLPIDDPNSAMGQPQCECFDPAGVCCGFFPPPACSTAAHNGTGSATLNWSATVIEERYLCCNGMLVPRSNPFPFMVSVGGAVTIQPGASCSTPVTDGQSFQIFAMVANNCNQLPAMPTALVTSLGAMVEWSADLTGHLRTGIGQANLPQTNCQGGSGMDMVQSNPCIENNFTQIWRISGGFAMSTATSCASQVGGRADTDIGRPDFTDLASRADDFGRADAA